jgi:hypothetical protein
MFSLEYYGFPCQFPFRQLVHTSSSLSMSCGAGTVIQIVADMPSSLSLTPPQEIQNIKQEGSG